MKLQDDKPYDEINITPMPISPTCCSSYHPDDDRDGARAQASLPRGSTAMKSTAEKKIKAITVDNAGKIYLDREEVTLAALEARLTEAKTANPDVPVIIKGDSGTQYQSVTDVLGVVVKLGIAQVGLATKAR